MKSTLINASSRNKLLKFIAAFSGKETSDGIFRISFEFEIGFVHPSLKKDCFLSRLSTLELQNIVKMLLEECTEEGRRTSEILSIGGMLKQLGMLYRDVDTNDLMSYNKAYYQFMVAVIDARDMPVEGII